LGVSRLVVVTDVPGILRTDSEGVKRVLPVVTVAEIEAMIASGEIYGGMIPKVRAAMECIQGEVQEVLIVNGAEPGILRQAVAEGSAGTRIVR
jgi:acetylglutamate kinase